MARHSIVRICVPVAAGMLVAACGSSVDNAAPRISEVPLQVCPGGQAMSLDLDPYVSDRENSPLSYAVAAGGGSFAGSTYTHTFDTIGAYEVTFTVSDGVKTTVGTISVQVTSANLAAVKQDNTDLWIFDTETDAGVLVTAGTTNPLFRTTLGTRRFVYSQQNNTQLWVYDTYTRIATQMGAGLGEAFYRGKTSDGKLVYSTGSLTEQTIWFYNPVTGLVRELGDGATASLTCLVSDSDVVFFEPGDGLQSDIAYFDPATDTIATVSAESTDEQLQAVLDTGGCVFSRPGSGGESDLYYFHADTGITEIGTDVPALADRAKTLWSRGSGGQVVFSALNGGDDELYSWNATTNVTTAIATGVDTEFAQVTDENEVLYYVVVSASEKDAAFHDLDSGTSATLRDSSDISFIGTVASGGGLRWAIIRNTSNLTEQHAVSLEAAPQTFTWSAGGTVLASGVLANGNVVTCRQDGTQLAYFDATAASWSTPIIGVGLDYGGLGLDSGDFVYTVDAGGQNDLYMWDDSAANSVAISTDAGDEAFGKRANAGGILFTRKVGTNVTRDVFRWDGTSITTVTGPDAEGLSHDHVVRATFGVTR